MAAMIGFLCRSRTRRTAWYISCEAAAPPPGELILRMMALIESSSSNFLSCLRNVSASRITPSSSITPIFSPKGLPPATSVRWPCFTDRKIKVKSAATKRKNAPPPMSTHSHTRERFFRPAGAPRAKGGGGGEGGGRKRVGGAVDNY